MQADETTTPRPARRGPQALRWGLGVVLGAKLALLLHGWGPALAVGAGNAPAGTQTASVAGAAKAAPGAVVRPDVRALLDALERRQAELDAREREIAVKEERLAVYEQDVVAKVASLEAIEKRLSARAAAASQAVDAAAESLAKIYGAMKPEAAAPILDRLDDPTVLTIFRRMKEKQVGEILPLMTRDRAIALTQALAERR
jgi:flagellar motility protein MotE (MotC chaperone)